MADWPHILLTNDDGIDAPGLSALREALADIARLTVCAPTAQRSASGHAVSVMKDMRLEERSENGKVWGWAKNRYKGYKQKKWEASPEGYFARQRAKREALKEDMQDSLEKLDAQPRPPGQLERLPDRKVGQTTFWAETGPMPEKGKYLGSGKFSEAWESADGTCVMKRIRDGPLPGGRDPLVLSQTERELMARRTVEGHNYMREQGYPVPKSWVAKNDPTVIVQVKAPGIDDANKLPTPEARKRAAQRLDMQDMAEYDHHQHVTLDRPPAGRPSTNVTWYEDGQIASWYDPTIPVDKMPELEAVNSRMNAGGHFNW